MQQAVVPARSRSVVTVSNICQTWKSFCGTQLTVDADPNSPSQCAVITMSGCEILNREVATLLSQLNTEKTSVQSAIYFIKDCDSPIGDAICKIKVIVHPDTQEETPGSSLALIAAQSKKRTRQAAYPSDADANAKLICGPTSLPGTIECEPKSQPDPAKFDVSEIEARAYDDWLIPVRLKPNVACLIHRFETSVSACYVGKGEFKGMLLTKAMTKEDNLPRVMILTTGPGEICAERLVALETHVSDALKGTGLIASPFTVAVNSIGFTMKHQSAT